MVNLKTLKDMEIELHERIVVAVAAVAFAAVFYWPASARAEPPATWTVICHVYNNGARPLTWANTTAPNITNGAFQFTLQDGTEVRTTAGMNCYATRLPAKAS